MKVKTLSSSPKSIRKTVDFARDYLEKGEYVIGPTETSYGLLVNASDEKLMRGLFELKGRDAGKPSAVFVRSIDDMKKYGVKPEKIEEELIQKYWPGPVSFVMNSDLTEWPGILSSEGKIGFRCSSHPFIQWLVSSCGCPITATSANLSGTTIHSRKDLEKYFSDKVKLLIIDPEVKFEGIPSTVVEFRGNDIAVLREGAVDSRLIRKTYRMLGEKDKIFRVMFICTGNTCRSPMAEGILRRMAYDENLDYFDVTSAGISTYDGYPASAFAVQVSGSAGIDISNSHSTQLTSDIMAEADIVIALAHNHFQKMNVLYPKEAGKIFMLREYPQQNGDPEAGVADPIGLDREFYQNTFFEIKGELERIWPDIKRRYIEKIEG